jgi:PDZ domain
MSAAKRWLVGAVVAASVAQGNLAISFGGVAAFSSPRLSGTISQRKNHPRCCSVRRPPYAAAPTSSLGDFTVELQKPLGIILEEQTVGAIGGVRVKEINPDGSASKSRIVTGDVIVQVNHRDVTESDFDSVMDAIISSPTTVQLTIGDGLGTFDMPKNVVAMLKNQEDAFFIDAIVREAVRQIRKSGRKVLGDLNKVEIIVGAGVQENGSRGMARFFAIFSTDGVSTYSCNVATTGIRQDDGSIKIVSLSCAKDEGLGQTYDLIREETKKS